MIVLGGLIFLICLIEVSIYFCIMNTQIFKYKFILFLFLLSISVSAQQFVEVSTNISGLGNVSSSWGDFDNDNDLDLAICGTTSNGNIVTKIYRNDLGEFVNLDVDILGMKNGSVEWGDIDNDNDLDLLLCGENSEQKAVVYRNDAGSFSEAYNFGYYGAYSYATFGDYNNDGFLDVLITGDWQTKIFENLHDGTFEQTNHELPDLMSSCVDWGDFDKDGDLDILLAGDSGGGMKSYVFENINGDFVELEQELPGLSSGKVRWGDYNNDGNLDILMMGLNDYLEPVAEVFVNYDNIFENIYAGLIPAALGDAQWGDYDNDGDLDIVIIGKMASCGSYGAAVFTNENPYFNNINFNFQTGQYASCNWVDYDLDGDLDVFLSGINGNGILFSKLYQNETTTPQDLPSIPENLTFEITENGVWLEWEAAFDNQTPQEALSYNIYLSDTPGETSLCSPMADLSTGIRRIIRFGNTGLSNRKFITGLQEGETYYWGVQTIDKNYSASDFSNVSSFQMIPAQIEENNKIQLWVQNPIYEKLVYFSETPITSITIFDLFGNQILVTQNTDLVELYGEWIPYIVISSKFY